MHEESAIMTVSTTPTATTTWKIDPGHTQAEFAVRHLMISTVKGRFADVQGVLHADDADPARSQVDVQIAVASIDTREAQRDAHLRSADFFDADHFPYITFRSTRIEGQGEVFKVVGDLTIRGTSREVVLDVTSEGRVTDPWGGERSGFSATTKIKRSDFGLTWNQLLEAGGVAVGDDVKISIDAELVKQAA
jgi:polyisoprenoid-binding protein YceI